MSRHTHGSKQVPGREPHVLQPARIRPEFEFPQHFTATVVDDAEPRPRMGVAPEDIDDLTLQFDEFRLVQKRIGDGTVMSPD